MTEYATIRVERERGVAFVTIDHPPINLLDAALVGDLARLQGELSDDDATRVVVFRSADPEFFVAHADAAMIQSLPREASAAAAALAGFHGFMERWRTLDQITMAQLEGRTRGGGSEFALALDLRFAAIGRAVLGQPEVALGIIPGAGGTQRLARLLGRARAIEVVVGCGDVDAALAERYGWVNRALPADELGPFVARLAHRIASYPPNAVRLAKRAIDAAAAGFEGALARGVQTREGELDLQAALDATLDASGGQRA